MPNKIWGFAEVFEHMLKVSPFAAYHDLFEPPMGVWDRQWEQELSAPRCITPERGWFEAAAASSMPQSHCAPQFRSHSPGSTVGISSAAPVRSARRRPSSGENDTPRSPGMPPSMLTPEHRLQQQQQQQQQRQQRQQQQQRRLISESLESTVSLPTLPSGLLGDAMEKESPAVAHELRRAAADALGKAADGSAANKRQAPSAAGPLSVSTDGTSGEVRVRCTLSVVR